MPSRRRSGERERSPLSPLSPPPSPLSPGRWPSRDRSRGREGSWERGRERSRERGWERSRERERSPCRSCCAGGAASLRSDSRLRSGDREIDRLQHQHSERSHSQHLRRLPRCHWHACMACWQASSRGLPALLSSPVGWRLICSGHQLAIASLCRQLPLLHRQLSFLCIVGGDCSRCGRLDRRDRCARRGAGRQGRRRRRMALPCPLPVLLLLLVLVLLVPLLLLELLVLVVPLLLSRKLGACASYRGRRFRAHGVCVSTMVPPGALWRQAGRQTGWGALPPRWLGRGGPASQQQRLTVRSESRKGRQMGQGSRGREKPSAGGPGMDGGGPRPFGKS